MTGILLAVLLFAQESGSETVPASASPAAEHAAEATAMAPAENPHAEAAHEQAAPGEAEHGEEHGPAQVMMHHVLDGPIFGLPSKHLVFFVVAAFLVILLTQLAVRSYDPKRQPKGLGSVVETFVLFIRDEIAESNIGHDGHRFVPLLCSFFFFILVAALLGLLPFSATSTGNIAVTMGLAIVSFAAQQYAGISKFGLAGHLHNLVPPGLPAWLLPMMIPVEILSMFTKPFALMVRLFANMLAGHMVITALLILIPLMAQISSAFGVLIAPVSIGLSLFIMLLELLVALIQAYIFTLLTAIFIGMYAHPAH